MFFTKDLKQESAGSSNSAFLLAERVVYSSDNVSDHWKAVGQLFLQYWSNSTLGIARDCQTLSVAIISRDCGLFSKDNNSCYELEENKYHYLLFD